MLLTFVKQFNYNRFVLLAVFDMPTHQGTIHYIYAISYLHMQYFHTTAQSCSLG